MDTVDVAREIATGGTFGLILALVVGFGLFVRGTLRVGELVDRDRREAYERRERETTRLIAERDAAIALAKSYADNFERALDVIEGKDKPR